MIALETIELEQTIEDGSVSPSSDSCCSQADGPCVIEYRDRHWNHHPLRRTWSCLGCRHLVEGEAGGAYCGHPEMIEKWGCNQWNKSPLGKVWVTCEPFFCPVLRQQGTGWPKQPEPQPIDAGPDRDPDAILREWMTRWNQS